MYWRERERGGRGWGEGGEVGRDRNKQEDRRIDKGGRHSQTKSKTERQRQTKTETHRVPTLISELVSVEHRHRRTGRTLSLFCVSGH